MANDPGFSDQPLWYDPTTANGQVRALLADTDPTAVVWVDPEIDAALSRFGNNVELSAAWLCEMAATDAAKLAIKTRTESTNTDLTGIADALRQRAKDLRAIAIVPMAVSAPDPVFTMTTDGGLTPGNMGAGLW